MSALGEANIILKNLARRVVTVASGLQTDDIGFLCHLAEKELWGTEECLKCDSILRYVEINGQLHTLNQRAKFKAYNAELPALAHELAIAVLCKLILIGFERQENFAKLLKKFNALLKAKDVMQPDWLKDASLLKEGLDKHWIELGKELPKKENIGEVVVPKCLDLPVISTLAGLTELPLTVLFYEGPIARAYLACLHAMGCKPKKIIQLIAEHDIETDKPVGRWLPRFMRSAYAYQLQKNKIHYWPKYITKHYKELYTSISVTVGAKLGFAQPLIAHAQSLPDLRQYSDVVEPVLIQNLSDKRLHEYLRSEPDGLILYSGGGMMPRGLLSISGLKFLHIHPGFLPDIRGADGVLWSSLLKQRVSASCFYMSEQIDAGDIIMSSWLPEIKIDYLKERLDSKMLYRAIYGFLDPWVRAFILRKLILEHENLAGIACQPQDKADGLTFHFMHPTVLELALNSVFVD